MAPQTPTVVVPVETICTTCGRPGTCGVHRSDTPDGTTAASRERNGSAGRRCGVRNVEAGMEPGTRSTTPETEVTDTRPSLENRQEENRQTPGEHSVEERDVHEMVHQRSPEVIRVHQRSPEFIRGHQSSSEVIRGYQSSSEVTRGHQRSPEFWSS
ncbi:hypothetical protein EYF80_063951 [Liparis tanakae]|uniref:Uncharacterized protein n=1 Tax=Liparis tanakae TaxID=230148 RepID=A0A4Z2EB10_9TELE|nr:hypothetical protein EYF80_063951 [Liparis tanakae]